LIFDRLYRRAFSKTERLSTRFGHAGEYALPVAYRI
jgi:hypothetical protein